MRLFRIKIVITFYVKNLVKYSNCRPARQSQSPRPRLRRSQPARTRRRRLSAQRLLSPSPAFACSSKSSLSSVCSFWFSCRSAEDSTTCLVRDCSCSSKKEIFQLRKFMQIALSSHSESEPKSPSSCSADSPSPSTAYS